MKYHLKVIVIIIVRVYDCGTGMPQHACGGQRTVLWSGFSPSTFRWDLGIELRSPGFHDKHLFLAHDIISQGFLFAVCYVPADSQKCMFCT